MVLAPKELEVFAIRFPFDQEHCLRLAEERIPPRYERVVTETMREGKRFHPLVTARIDPLCLSRLAPNDLPFKKDIGFRACLAEQVGTVRGHKDLNLKLLGKVLQNSAKFGLRKL